MCMPALQLRRWGLLIALQVLLLQASLGQDVNLMAEAVQLQGSVQSGTEGRGLLQDTTQAASQAASAGAGEQVAGQPVEPSLGAAAAAQPSVTEQAAGSSGDAAPDAAHSPDSNTAAEQAAGQPAAASSIASTTTPAAVGEKLGPALGPATASPASPPPVSPYTVAVPQQGPEAYIAICAAVKDQHIDVREWIFYHRAVGASACLPLPPCPHCILVGSPAYAWGALVQSCHWLGLPRSLPRLGSFPSAYSPRGPSMHHPITHPALPLACLLSTAGINKFYLIDTGSKPPMQTVLEDYINIGLVEYSFDTAIPPREGTHGPQVTVYERCLKNHGHRCGWAAGWMMPRSARAVIAQLLSVGGVSTAAAMQYANAGLPPLLPSGWRPALHWVGGAASACRRAIFTPCPKVPRSGRPAPATGQCQRPHGCVQAHLGGFHRR